MTTNQTDAGWLGRLAAAAVSTRAGSGPAALRTAAEALRLAWATGCAVHSGDPDRELWWLRLAEAIAETADELELIPGAPLVPLGTGPAPPAALCDSPAVRRAVADLLAGVRDTLISYSDQAGSGREKLTATLTAGAAARAVSAGST